ncbi:MAG: hypothetical protein ABR564_05400 [Candidatus Dormibacteria bacterium]
MRLPLGRKGLLAALPIAAGVVFWRVRASQRAAQDRLWDADIEAAAEEGVAAARTPRTEPPAPS